MSRPTVGSLFSGAAGMTRGFERAGFETMWHAEIDRDASSVLRRHYRETPNLGSVQDIHGGRIEPVDVMEGGSPCQDVSQAGNRAGLEGKRSGLFFDYVRIVREMREATNGRYPAVVVLENVDGLLSSNRGRDFAAVLGRLQELGAAVAYRVLDAQFFGVPQRRRRVFVVADFAPIGVGEERAAQILALRESLCRHPAPGDEARQGSAGSPEDGARVGGYPYTVHGEHSTAMTGNGDANVAFPSRTARALDTTGGYATNQGGTVILEPLAFGGNNCSGPIDVATACLADGWHGDFESETFIVAPWDEAQITSAANRSRVENGSPAPTLNGSGQVGIVAAEIASTLQASAGHHGHSSPRGDGSDNLIAEALAFQDSQSETRIGQCLGTLDSNYGSRRRHGIFERYGLKWIVRRLTPTEGEALMGWPRDWTRWRDDGQQISDSARWKMIGNGVATPVAYWLASRLRAALEGVACDPQQPPGAETGGGAS